MRIRGTALSFAAASLLSLTAVQTSATEKVILDDDFGSFSPTLIMLLSIGTPSGTCSSV